MLRLSWNFIELHKTVRPSLTPLIADTLEHWNEAPYAILRITGLLCGEPFTQTASFHGGFELLLSTGPPFTNMD